MSLADDLDRLDALDLLEELVGGRTVGADRPARAPESAGMPSDEPAPRLRDGRLGLRIALKAAVPGDTATMMANPDPSTAREVLVLRIDEARGSA